MARGPAAAMPLTYSTTVQSEPGSEKNLLLQRIFLLYSHQSNVNLRLSSLTPDFLPPSDQRRRESSPEPAGSEASSASSSPMLQGRSTFPMSTPQSSPLPHSPPRPGTLTPASRRSTSTISSIPEDSILPQTAMTFINDSHELFYITHEIKAVLTDLLNCDAVRVDSEMRAWVQKQLMAAELEIRRQRKRKVSAPAIVISSSDEEDEDAAGERRAWF